MILVDTSAWVDYFRAAPTPERLAVRELLRDTDEVVATEPIIMELLAGASGNTAKTEALVNGLPTIPIFPSEDFRTAGLLYRASGRNGHPIRSMVDCLIAAIAIRREVPVLHRDRDFTFLAEISPLRLYRS